MRNHLPILPFFLASDLLGLNIPEDKIPVLVKHIEKWRKRPLSLEGFRLFYIDIFLALNSHRLPIDLTWEVEWDTLKLEKTIGKGAFGEVWLAKLKGREV